MNHSAEFPSSTEIRTELNRINRNRHFRRVLARTASSILAVCAIATLLGTRVFPVFCIYGSSMSPTLQEGDIVLAVNTGHYEPEDLIAFFSNNKLLVKRVLANAGSWVTIDTEGTIYIDDVCRDEPYLTDKSLDPCDIAFPYQVPEGRVFVMGDHRSVSLDSRMEEIGCIASEQIAGTLRYVIWPLSHFKRITN